MMRIAERRLPSPKLRHPYPDWRFDVMTQVGARALAAHAWDLCGGSEQSPVVPRRRLWDRLRTPVVQTLPSRITPQPNLCASG
jgi:hypothetical protein